MNATLLALYQAIVKDLESEGKKSLYKADANESDPRYFSYGVRANEKKQIFKKHRKTIRQLSQQQQITLAKNKAQYWKIWKK